MLKILKRLNRASTGVLIKLGLYFKHSPSKYQIHQLVKAALAEIPQDKKHSVLDAGAGRMPFKPLLTEHYKEYTAMDIEKHVDDIDVVGDIMDLNFSDDSFDLVFSTQVIEHVPRPWDAFKEIARVLKSGGYVVITVPHLGYLHNLPHDYYRYTASGLRTLAHSAGLEPVWVRPAGGFFSFLGYIRTTIITPIFGIPLLGILFVYLSLPITYLEMLLDKITMNSKVFPLNYVLYAKKKD